MKVFGMGLPELLIILAVVLLIFGPKHLPKLGAALGSTVKNLRDGLGSNKNDDMEEIVEEAVDEEPRKTTKALEGETKKKAPRKTRAKNTASTK
ncbi:MAG: twin-arginine translocase TatA/TatE family subunit [Raoultibacter sp.]|jgi:sec-independent protein translocase protein TatA